MKECKKSAAIYIDPNESIFYTTIHDSDSSKSSESSNKNSDSSSSDASSTPGLKPSHSSTPAEGTITTTPPTKTKIIHATCNFHCQPQRLQNDTSQLPKYSVRKNPLRLEHVQNMPTVLRNFTGWAQQRPPVPVINTTPSPPNILTRQMTLPAHRFTQQPLIPTRIRNNSCENMNLPQDQYKKRENPVVYDQTVEYLNAAPGQNFQTPFARNMILAPNTNFQNQLRNNQNQVPMQSPNLTQKFQQAPLQNFPNQTPMQSPKANQKYQILPVQNFQNQQTQMRQNQLQNFQNNQLQFQNNFEQLNKNFVVPFFQNNPIYMTAQQLQQNRSGQINPIYVTPQQLQRDNSGQINPIYLTPQQLQLEMSGQLNPIYANYQDIYNAFQQIQMQPIYSNNQQLRQNNQPPQPQQNSKPQQKALNYLNANNPIRSTLTPLEILKLLMKETPSGDTTKPISFKEFSKLKKLRDRTPPAFVIQNPKWYVPKTSK